MDNVGAWAPKPFAVAAAWVGTLAAVAWAVATDDPPARVLAVAAVALLAAAALVGTLVRPRLAADADGLRVAQVTGSRRWAWPDVHRVQVVATRRFGRSTGMLEIDALDSDGTERLVVLTALDLGADPVDVAAELERLSGGRRRPRS